MAKQLMRILVFIVVMAVAMPVFAKERLHQVSSRLLQSLKVSQFSFTQEMKWFGQPALTAVFTQAKPLGHFLRQIQNGKTEFHYADVMNGDVFLHAGLSNAYATLHLFATSANSFRGELSVIGVNQALASNLSSFNTLVAARFLSWIPAGAQLLLDIELPGKEAVLQQLYQLEQSVPEVQRYISDRLLAMNWLPDREASLEMGFWHKGNESLYVFVHELASGTGIYLMKNIKKVTQ